MLFSDNYAFQQTYQRIILEADSLGAESRFQVICQGAYDSEYKGDNSCAYNVARTLVDAKNLLEKKVSKNPDDWKWRNLHLRQYVNLPWSRTPLRFLFHRDVPHGGNNNTPDVSGIKLRKNRKNVILESVHVAAFKMVVNFDESDETKDTSLYMIDTGMNGNPFQGHYFDLNQDHIDGKLRKMRIGRDV